MTFDLGTFLQNTNPMAKYGLMIGQLTLTIVLRRTDELALIFTGKSCDLSDHDDFIGTVITTSNNLDKTAKTLSKHIGNPLGLVIRGFREMDKDGTTPVLADVYKVGNPKNIAHGLPQ